MGEGASPAGDDDVLLRRELRRGAIPVEVRLAADELWITSTARDEVPAHEIPVEGVLDHLLTIWRHLLETRDRSDERAPEG